MFCKIAFFHLRNMTKNTLNSFYQDESEILFMHLFRPSWISLQCTSAYYCPLHRGGEIPRRNPSSSPVYMEKYLQLKHTVSIRRKKSRFAWSWASQNICVMMTFLLFTHASKRWLGWRKTEIPRSDRLGWFCDNNNNNNNIVRLYFDTLLRYMSSVTFSGAAVLKVMDQVNNTR